MKAAWKRLLGDGMFVLLYGALVVSIAGAGVSGYFAYTAPAEFAQGWVLRVDGEVVAAAPDEQTLTAAYEACVAAYQTGEAGSVEVLNRVETEACEYSTSLPQGEEIPQVLAQCLSVRTEWDVETVNTIPVETVVVEDATMYEGDSETHEGHDGEQVQRTTVVCLNGEEYLRKEHPAQVTVEMDPTVITNGTKARPEYCWPCDGGVITSYFGYRDSPTAGASSYHQGVDIAAGYGTNIYSIRQGTVTETGYNSSRGYYVTVCHDNGVVSIYMHLSKILVNEGESVKMGEHIAEMGSTGISTGSHLHLSVVVNGVNRNPLKYIKR